MLITLYYYCLYTAYYILQVQNKICAEMTCLLKVCAQVFF